MILSAFTGLTILSLAGLLECEELFIFFTEPGSYGRDGQIVKIEVHHWTYTRLNLTNIHTPDAIDYDEFGEQIYWTDAGLKQIRRAGKHGENDTVVAQLGPRSNPSGLALDSVSRQVFYSDKGTKEIGTINMDTLDRTILLSSGLYSTKGLVAHSQRRKLFWFEEYGREIKSCDYTGKNIRVITEAQVRGLTLDEKADRLYWTTEYGEVKSMLTDSTILQTIYSNVEFFFLQYFDDISVFNGYIYLTMAPVMINNFDAMPIDGSHVTSLLYRETFSYPNRIHAFSPNNLTRVCEDHFYGSNCLPCGKCKEDRICEKTTGVCLSSGCQAGYQMHMCQERCKAGRWGENCRYSCGACKLGTVCDIYNGTCPYGCRDGYTDEKCKSSPPKLTCTGSFRADHTVQSIRSRHKYKRETCRFDLYTNDSDSIYVRIHFPRLDPLPDHICKGSDIVVDNGTLGRYCDQNSTLLKSKGKHLMIESRSGGPMFDFKILYSVEPFTDDVSINSRAADSQGSDIPVALIAGVCVSVLLLIFISGCLVHKFCSPCKRRQSEVPNRSSTELVIDRTVYSESRQFGHGRSSTCRRSNPLYEADPPPYWSVFASGNEASVRYMDAPPSYDAVTGASNPSLK